MMEEKVIESPLSIFFFQIRHSLSDQFHTSYNSFFLIIFCVYQQHKKLLINVESQFCIIFIREMMSGKLEVIIMSSRMRRSKKMVTRNLSYEKNFYDRIEQYFKNNWSSLNNLVTMNINQIFGIRTFSG